MSRGKAFATLLALLLGLPTAPATAAPTKIAIFDLELHDTSLEGELRGRDPAETARLQQLTTMLREAVTARAELEPVDTAPLRARLDAMPALYSCSGCETKLAAELGAERALSGYVYKISTLILYITLTVRDAESGTLLGKKSVSIRGNTDESWQHGLNYLLETQILTTAKK